MQLDFRINNIQNYQTVCDVVGSLLTKCSYISVCERGAEGRMQFNKVCVHKRSVNCKPILLSSCKGVGFEVQVKVWV